MTDKERIAQLEALVETLQTQNARLFERITDLERRVEQQPEES